MAKMITRSKRLAFAGLAIATLCLGRFVLAQTGELQASELGLDAQAIKARADAFAQDAAQLVHHALAQAEQQKPTAQDTSEGGHANVAHYAARLTPNEKGAIDFNAIIKGASENAATPSAPQFMVFASLSIPPASLRPLIVDTSKAGGVIVFQGFPNNSVKDFSARLRTVIGPQDSFKNIIIDPRLFRAYQITAAPSFVVAASPFEPCDGLRCTTATPPSDRMIGNVGVEYALGRFVEDQGPGALIARVALQQLQSAQ